MVANRARDIRRGIVERDQPHYYLSRSLHAPQNNGSRRFRSACLQDSSMAVPGDEPLPSSYWQGVGERAEPTCSREQVHHLGGPIFDRFS